MMQKCNGNHQMQSGAARCSPGEKEHVCCWHGEIREMLRCIVTRGGDTLIAASHAATPLPPVSTSHWTEKVDMHHNTLEKERVLRVWRMTIVCSWWPLATTFLPRLSTHVSTSKWCLAGLKYKIIVLGDNHLTRQSPHNTNQTILNQSLQGQQGTIVTWNCSDHSNVCFRAYFPKNSFLWLALAFIPRNAKRSVKKLLNDHFNSC